MPKIKIPLAEYAPDLPNYPSDGSDNVLNVYPRTAESYGPINSPAAQLNALGARCQGGAAYKDSNGNVTLVVGDATNLYTSVSGSGTWTNASKSPGAYNATDQIWNFTYFNGQIIATDFGDNPQVLTLIGGTGTFNDLGGSPPRGKYVAIVKNVFVVFGNTYDPTNGNMPQRIWWSAAGDASDWPSLGSNDAAQKQSGAVDLLGPGGVVQGFAPDLLNADAVVFQEYAVRRMTYTGPPTVFTVLPVENARGAIAPGSIVVNGGIAYYWGQDGIYAFDGATSTPIGASKVDKTVYDDVDMFNINRVIGAADPANKLIWWAYPSKQNSGGNPDRLLCYAWQLQRWSLAEVTTETLLRLLTVGYTLDELWTIFGYTIDTVPAPFDSSVWLGGVLNLGMFNTDHKLAFFTGSPLAASVDSSEFTSGPDAPRVLVRNARPLVDGGSPTVAIGTRDTLQSAVSFTAARAVNSLGQCPQRISGGYVTARLGVPSSTAWAHISGVELDIVAQGDR